MVKEKNNVAITSVKQIPRLLKTIQWKPNTNNLDIGGGKYDLGTNYLAGLGVTNWIYDPYNRTEEQNKLVIDYSDVHSFDTVTLSNVLNVIENAAIRQKIILQARRALKISGTCYISVYEGDKSSIGKIKKTGSYQANRKLIEYVDEVSMFFRVVRIEKNIIIAKEPRYESSCFKTIRFE